MAYVGSDSTQSSGGTADAGIPAHSAGDRLDLIVASTGGDPADTIATPTGWTLGPTVEAGAGSAVRISHFYKSGNGSETVVEIAPNTGSDGWAAYVVAHSGRDTTAIHASGTAETESSSTITSPAVLTSVDDCDLIYVGHFDDNDPSQAEFIGDAGFSGTFRAFEQRSSPGNGFTSAVSTHISATAGTTDACVWDNTANEGGVALTLALAPSAGGGAVLGDVRSTGSAVGRVTGTKQATGSVQPTTSGAGHIGGTKTAGGSARLATSITGRHEGAKKVGGLVRSVGSTTIRTVDSGLLAITGAARAAVSVVARVTGSKSAQGVVSAPSAVTGQPRASKRAMGAVRGAGVSLIEVVGAAATAGINGSAQALLAVTARVTGRKLADGSMRSTSSAAGLSHGAKQGYGSMRSQGTVLEVASGSKLGTGLARIVGAVTARETQAPPPPTLDVSHKAIARHYHEAIAIRQHEALGK